jgi:hypothetical protein
MLVTFQGPAVKIVENHAGKAFVKISPPAVDRDLHGS